MRSLMVLALTAIALSGCLSDASPDDVVLDVPTLVDPSTFVSPHFEAHPAYGYPTNVDYSGFIGGAIPDAWMPPAPVEIPEVITSVEHAAQATDVASGAGIHLFGHYAIVSGNGPGSIVDIADPMNPVKVADIEVGVRDADVIAHPDGTLTAILASNGPIYVFDITTPETPEQLPTLETSSHNAAVVPGTPIVYNANSAGGAGGLVPNNPGAWVGNGNGQTEIFDLTDPENPVELPAFENGYGCHDITFFISDEKQRAYCAGIEMTQIWDIADPLNPTVIANIPVHHGVAGTPSASVPLVFFSHLAMVNHDASVLIVGDETGGGLANSCDVYVDAAGRTVSGPTGNLWFYDLSDETNPVLKSWMNPTNPATTEGYEPGNPANGDVPPGCTAHFGRLIEDRDMMVMSFYGAGVVLVDFSNLDNPKIVDQWNDGTNMWDAQVYQGYVFTGDLNRGLDVLTFA